MPSSLISLLFGLSPLMVGLLAHGVFKSQLLRIEQWLGLVVAFLGLMIIFSHGLIIHQKVIDKSDRLKAVALTLNTD